MRAMFPYPLLSCALFVMWVLLTGFSPGHIVLGAVVATMVARVMLTLAPEKPHIRFGPAMIKLAGLVLVDIVKSNLAVARISLTNPRQRTAGFVRIPIALTSPYALATLAIIISATPGTLWLQHDAGNKTVLIHVLDYVGEEEWVAIIKDRYEKLLMEIFE